MLFQIELPGERSIASGAFEALCPGLATTAATTLLGNPWRAPSQRGITGGYREHLVSAPVQMSFDLDSVESLP
jgi:hypothetical protein